MQSKRSNKLNETLNLSTRREEMYRSQSAKKSKTPSRKQKSRDIQVVSEKGTHEMASQLKKSVFELTKEDTEAHRSG